MISSRISVSILVSFIARHHPLAIIPVAILFNYFLDDFVEGITAGSTK